MPDRPNPLLVQMRGASWLRCSSRFDSSTTPLWAQPDVWVGVTVVIVGVELLMARGRSGSSPLQ